jgi:hypothetical protein
VEQGRRALRIPSHLPAHQVAQREDHWIGNLVADGNALALSFDQVMIVQDPQVLGNIGLLHGTGLHKLVDAQRPVMQRLQQNQAAGLRKDGEQRKIAASWAADILLFFAVDILPYQIW